VADAASPPLTGIESLRAVMLSPVSVEIYWETGPFADSEVRYGKDQQLSATPVRHSRAKRYHAVLLQGLLPGTRYFYQARSTGRSGTLSSAVGEFTTLLPDTCKVRSERPRLFFTQQDIPTLRQRIGGSHVKYWQKLRQKCDSMLNQTTAELTINTDSGANQLALLAFAGLIGDVESYRRKAIDAALVAAAVESMSSLDRGSRRDGMEGMATVYDWLYPYLSSTQKATLREGMLRYIDGFAQSDTDRIFGHAFENLQSVVQVAIALHGDAPAAEERLDQAVYDYRYNYFPSWRHYVQDGGSVMTWDYTMYTLRQVFDAMLAFRSGTNLDYFEAEPWPEKLVDWLCYGLREDNRFQHLGDGKVYDGFMARHRFMAVVLATMYRNPRAQWLAQKMEREKGIWSTNCMYDILFYDPELEAQPVDGPLSRQRDTWSSGAVQLLFRSAPDYVMGHTHLDNNSFTIYYKGGQAIDSGYYDKFGSSHHRNYASRTIAHNSMLVFDPTQTFRIYNSTYYVNDGGQHWKRQPEEVENARPLHVHDVLDPAKGFQVGGVAVYEHTDGYTYVMGDAAGSYSPTKLRSFDRHLVFLNRVSGYTKPVTVVFDWVVSTNGDFKKTYLLHTMKQPQVNGQLVSATHLQGMIFQQTLLPANARISVVGGSGKEFFVNGQNYPTSRAYSDYDEVGAYRVEVSPGVAATEDHFLHLLYAADAGSAAPPAAKRIQGTGMTGLLAGGIVVLFPLRRGAVADAAYQVPAGVSLSHLLCGLEPLAVYEVLLDGASQGRVNATRNGTLHFETEVATHVSVRRVEGQ
jgi:hypothetical protein